MRVYPSADPNKQTEYLMMLEQSKNLFNQFTSGGSRSTYNKGNTAFGNATGERDMSKTNPVPKAKATDLLGRNQNGSPGSPQKNFSGTSNRFNNVKSSGYGMTQKPS